MAGTEGASLAGLKLSFVFHKFDRGGSLRVGAYLARGFKDRGVDVELVLFTDQGEVEEIITQLMGSDTPVTYLGHWSGPRALDLARGLPALARHLRARQPGVVIAGANNSALVTARARSIAGLHNSTLIVKTTNPIASSRHQGFVKWLRRATYRRLFRDATAIWTLSASETQEMREAFPEHAAIFRDVFNPYVTPAMLGDAAATGSPSSPPVILSVARLTAQKRLERLIDAFAQVRDPGVQLRILGEGEQRAELEAQVGRLGLKDRVSMPGYVADVAGAYRAARLLVLTSDYEGLPAVVLEAMAADCPVLTTDCFPAARAITAEAPGCAIIDDLAPAALAARIEAHLVMPRPKGLRAIAERYSIENGVASHVAALKDALLAP